MLAVFLKHLIQKSFFLLDLLYERNHGVVIGGDDMAQGHLMYVHGGLTDFRQTALAVHIVVSDV